MSKVLIAIVVLVGSFLSTQIATAGEHGQEQALLALEQSRIDALMTRDVSKMAAMLAPDLIHVTSSGLSRSKALYIQDFAKSKKKFLEFELLNTKVQVFGKVALITGKYRNMEQVKGSDPVEKFAYFTRFYRRTADDWLLVSHQATAAKTEK